MAASRWRGWPPPRGRSCSEQLAGLRLAGVGARAVEADVDDEPAVVPRGDADRRLEPAPARSTSPPSSGDGRDRGVLAGDADDVLREHRLTVEQGDLDGESGRSGRVGGGGEVDAADDADDARAGLVAVQLRRRTEGRWERGRAPARSAVAASGGEQRARIGDRIRRGEVVGDESCPPDLGGADRPPPRSVAGRRRRGNRCATRDVAGDRQRSSRQIAAASESAALMRRFRRSPGRRLPASPPSSGRRPRRSPRRTARARPSTTVTRAVVADLLDSGHAVAAGRQARRPARPAPRPPSPPP